MYVATLVGLLVVGATLVEALSCVDFTTVDQIQPGTRICPFQIAGDLDLSGVNLAGVTFTIIASAGNVRFSVKQKEIMPRNDLNVWTLA